MRSSKFPWPWGGFDYLIGASISKISCVKIPCNLSRRILHCVSFNTRLLMHIDFAAYDTTPLKVRLSELRRYL